MQKLLYRQGDVLFTRINKLPAGTRTKRDNGTVAYGEVTGHSHTLTEESQASAEVLEIGEGLYVSVSDTLTEESRASAEVLEISDGLYVSVSNGGVSIHGAMFAHEEHGPVTLPPGSYRVTIQREYSPEAIRDVLD